jgi:hypothetical protein
MLTAIFAPRGVGRVTGAAIPGQRPAVASAPRAAFGLVRACAPVFAGA